MEHAPKDSWLETPEGKAWLEYAFLRSESRKFTSLTIVLVIAVFGMRIYDIPISQILFTVIMWFPSLTAVKNISYANAKLRLEQIRKKLSQG